MSKETGGIFQFGEFQVDALARALRREEEIVTLNRRAFDVLLYLVQNPGRVLTRDELLKNVWPDTFVDENSLAQSISVLRRALEEKPGDNNYIVTLPGRGYQFISPVKVVAQESLSTPDVATPSSDAASGLLLQQQTIRTSVIREEEQLSLPIPQRWGGARLVAALAVTAAAVVGIYAWKQVHRVSPPMPPPAIARAPARRSIAVLGFRNLSGRPEEGWISTALAEMLSTELVAGEKLRLVSGEDIARTKLELPLADADSLSQNTLTRLHKDLNSDLIVLGSYTALGEKPATRIRLDLRLQDTTAGETIADIAVMGNEADLFDLVSQAGSQLREKLGVEAVSPVEAVSIRASSPSNRDAARLYSEGVARLRVFDALGARDLLQQAVAADPKFSLSHSALAEAWFRMGYDKKAQSEARQAYDLSVNLSREDKLLVEGRYRHIAHEYEKAIEIYRTLLTLFPDNLDYGLNLTRAQIRGGKAHDVLATVESLRKLMPPASEDPRIDLEEADAWNALSDHTRRVQPLARAVEKARAQGARLILGEAREKQCQLFGYYLQQMEVSVPACRESRDIFAAAGDRNNEAWALISWAAAIQEENAPEAIRLNQQALTEFRRVGSERGVAVVLSNLGIIYAAQGDPAAAEKVQRQALASGRLLDDKRNEAKYLGNIANDRVAQGDLRGALQLYEESTRVDPEDAGRVTIAGFNIAAIHQLQGDLEGARQGFEKSLAAWQKTGVQDGAEMSALGSVLLDEADFSGARQIYEQALAITTAAGDKLTIAEIQLALADLSLEEARPPVEQESAVRQALDIFQKQKSRDDEIGAWNMLARVLVVEDRGAPAKEAMQHARALAARSQNPEIRWRTAITAARVETADKAAAGSAAGIAARKELESVITKSRELGYHIVELDARLALAEIEMKAGQTAAGRAHLSVIEADAKAKGYILVAHKATIARG